MRREQAIQNKFYGWCNFGPDLIKAFYYSHKPRLSFTADGIKAIVVKNSGGYQGACKQSNIRGARQAKKITDLPGGQFNDPLLRKRHSLPHLPATPWSLSWTLEGPFEMIRRPLRPLTCVAFQTIEKHRHCLVWIDRHGTEVLGHRQEQP